MHSKRMCLTAMTVALVAYGFDCVGMITPGQATQCCKAMRCRLHVHHYGARHDQNCCRNSLQMRTVFGSPPSFVQGVPVSPIALDVVSVFGYVQVSEFFAAIAEHCNDPPLSSSMPVLALRI
jgi:hypothetical protein